MSALSSDVAGDVDMAIDEHDDSAMNVDEAHTADQEGASEVEQPSAKRAKVGEEGKEQDDGMGDEEQAVVRKFPTDVPMENEYPGTNYYVRKCYSTYYDLVKHLFDDKGKKGVTITGTPGIGKSVFMGYFFQRYSKEFFKLYNGSSEAMILLASYDKTSVLKKVVIVRNGKDPVITRYNRAAMDDARTNYTEAAGGKALWLLDGPPDSIPEDVRWVSFTSLNEVWMKKLSKKTKTTAKIYMPVWELDEMRDAASKLSREDLLATIDNYQLRTLGFNPTDLSKLGPRKAVIDVRFQVFGGVPRVCFDDPDAVEIAFDELVESIYGMTPDELAGAMTSKNLPLKVHRLLHYVPLTYWKATVEIGSAEIEHRFRERQLEITDEMRSRLESVARDIPEASVMLGFILEARTYQLLRSGCTLDATLLHGKGAQSLKVDIPKMTEPLRITNSFEISEGFDCAKTQVVTPVKKNFESVDGFVWIPGDENHPNSVVLLQITVAQKHPVKAMGYLRVLKKLGLWETVVERVRSAEKSQTAEESKTAEKSLREVAALVFVVPRASSHTFAAQPVMSKSTTRDDSYVGAIHRIGRKTADKLNSAHIWTVEDLRNYVLPRDDLAEITRKVILKAKKALQKHEEGKDAVDQASLEVLERIPQYVWKI